MTRLLLTFVLFGSTMISRAQLYTDHSVSELISALQKNIPDSNRVQLYLQLVRKIYFERGDSKKSLDTVFLFLQKAEQLSAEIHSLKWQPEIFAYLGKYYYKTGDFIQADYFRDRAINYMATNIFEAGNVFADAIANGLALDSIYAEKSPLCRPKSDCWDVVMRFFNPKDRLGTALTEYRLTVDVNDISPVAIGTRRKWARFA